MSDNRASDASNKYLFESEDRRMSIIGALLMCILMFFTVLAICFLAGCKAFTIGS